MKTMTEKQFLKWAAEKGLGPDPKYPNSAVLDFQGPSESRFWKVPEGAAQRPYFLSTLIDLMGEWQTCYVWRHLGRWPDPANVSPHRITDAVELNILRGVGVPLGTAAVIAFDRSERAALVTLLFSTTIFGWSVADDLYVVPDHARQLLQTDHHDVIHVSFAADDDLRHWVSKMAEEEYDLPKELPDATFRRPDWMG